MEYELGQEVDAYVIPRCAWAAARVMRYAYDANEVLSNLEVRLDASGEYRSYSAALPGGIARYVRPRAPKGQRRHGACVGEGCESCNHGFEHDLASLQEALAAERAAHAATRARADGLDAKADRSRESLKNEVLVLRDQVRIARKHEEEAKDALRKTQRRDVVLQTERDANAAVRADLRKTLDRLNAVMPTPAEVARIVDCATTRDGDYDATLFTDPVVAGYLRRVAAVRAEEG